MGKSSHGTVVTWTGYEQQECDLVAGWSAVSDGRGVDLGQWLALSSRRKRRTLMLTHRLSTSSFHNSTRRVPYSGRRRHTQYSCVYYSLTTLEWKNGQQEIVAAGWAVEGDEKLVWAQGGDEKEVYRLNRDNKHQCEKKKNIVCNWILFLTVFDLLVAGGTHKGTGSSFQRDQSSLDCCAWGTSPLFQALLPCQTLRLALGGGALTISKII